MKHILFLVIFLFITVPVLAADITACGTLNSAGTTYVLQNDVSSNGTCFTISAANITLDLNGHTVTYDNQVPITVPNGSFESADMADWDLTNAPNAERAAGTYIGTTVSAYDGDYAIRFALPANDQYILSSADVTLAANTAYSLSAMFRNSGNNESAENSANANRDPISLTISIDGTTYTATQTGVTWRGFQYTNATFTTGGSPVSGKIRISIANAATAGVQGYVYVDDIRILKANSYGVNTTTAATGFTVTNGVIAQGQGNGFASHIFNIPTTLLANFSIDHLTLTAQGVNSKIVYGLAAKISTINNNIINHNVTTIKSRDQFDGAAIHINYSSNNNNYGSTVYSNTFNSGIQTAINIGLQSGQTQHQIYDNNITLQTKVTNDFAIVAGSNDIYDNTINCGTGLNSCRGIVFSGYNTKVHGNTVTVQELKRNQEYNGCEMSGAYATQMEYIASGVDFYGNNITANSGDCEAYALRLNPTSASTINNSVHDNTFTVVRTGTARAAAVRIATLEADDVSISKNTFVTNDEWIYKDSGDGEATTTMTCNKWQTSGTLDSPFYPFSIYQYAGSVFTGTFHNNTYGTGDQARFESESFRDISSFAVDTDSSITLTTGAPFCLASGDIACSILGGRYLTPQTVTLTGEGLTIYYTTDGTTPTESSAQYSTAIPVLQNEALTTLKYFAKDTAGNSSAVQTQVYKCQRCR